MLSLRSFIMLLFILCMVACKEETKRDGSINFADVDGHKVTVCNLNQVSSKEIILLSDLVEDFEIIQLENTDEALFKAWVITVTDNFIGVRQHGNSPFKLFDRKGVFLHDIGKVGNGPGEYSISLYDEIIDEKNQRIYFAPFLGDKILVYGLDGKHIKDIQLPFRVQKPKISLSDKGIITLVHMPFANNKVFALQMDTEGNILKEIAPRNDMRVASFDAELFSYRNTPDLDIFLTSLDTLYHLNYNTLEMTPILTATGYNADDGWYCVYSELPDRYLMNVFNWKTHENRKIATLKDSETSNEVKLLNDYLGKLEMDFFFNKGYFIQNIEPGELIDKIEQHLSGPIPSQADKDKLSSLLDTLDEDHNNVLLIGKLKK